MIRTAGWPEGLDRRASMDMRGNMGSPPEAIERVTPRIRRFLTKRFRFQDAEDLSQNVALGLLEAFDRGVAVKSVVAYALTIARHEAGKHLYSKHSRFDDPLDVRTLLTKSPGLDPEGAAMAHERGLVLHNVIASLKPIDREIVERFYLQGQTKETITAEMGISLTIFRVRKHRAVRLIRETVHGV